MSIITQIIIFLIHITCEFSYSLDSIQKNVRHTFCFTIKRRSLPNTFHPDYSVPGRNGYDECYNEVFNNGNSDLYLKILNRGTKLFAQQKYVQVHSSNPSETLSHYSTLFSDDSASWLVEDLPNEKKGKKVEQVPIEQLDDPPDNEDFILNFVNNFDPVQNSMRLSWLHPMPCCISQMAAFHCVGDFMPKSLIRNCFDVTDGSNLDEILYTKLGPYYSTLSYDLFFKYQKGFYFDIDGTDFVKSEIKPLKLVKPPDCPEMESEKPTPSIPLGWRTFAVLGLFNSPTAKEDPSVYWPSRPLTDGDPPPRISSALFKYGDKFNIIASRDAVAPDGSLLYAKDKVDPGEFFRGEKGDMSIITSEPPEEYRRISRDTYNHMISEDGMWFKKHFENVAGSLSLLQALWARLSTTIIKSTSKVIRMYRLKTRKQYSKEIFSARNRMDLSELDRDRKKGPVEFNVGVLYFMAAPTLHHALQLVCSDPMARANLYKNLLMFEVEDALKDKMVTPKNEDVDNPREYLILGKYSQQEPIHMLSDRMLRFLIRSNCVKSYFELKSPRKDNLTDIEMPLEQLLPFKQYLNLMLKDKRVRSACLNVNSSAPIGNLTLINKFELDEAIEWAHRNPYTRAGCYDSLFVTMAHEVGFYGENSKFVLPVPVSKRLMPHGQEYVTINRDPIKILAERMKQHSGHILTVPFNTSKIVRKMNLKTEKVKKKMANRADRLVITLRKSVANKYTSENISNLYTSTQNDLEDYEVHERGKYSVLLPSDRLAVRSGKLAKVQTMPPSGWYTLHKLTSILEENAPTELDRPFYAKFLRDYIYVSLPEGHFFEPLYKYTDKLFHAREPGELDTDVSSQEMLMLEKYKVKPVTGFWIKKKDFYLFKNRDHVVIAQNKEGGDRALDEKALRAILVQDEVNMDMVRKGAGKERVDTARSYTRHEGRLISHLTPEEKLKTAFTVEPLNKFCERYTKSDDLPYSRYYEKGIGYSEDDPRHLMAHYPYEVYQIHLDFMEKLDRGLVSLEDDPLKMLVEGEYEPSVEGNSVSTWEDPDVDLLNTTPGEKNASPQSK
ncbi:uncharacterized protein TOT_020000380 [Theileria orientalis strain Shintoku]|uniref:Uncharacterized protein n=1 Tax=Theileria orientalis strain Shintoku TaxID=869250 RepID=J4CCW8_THEOR|nr:uncharacterized protein TOT_020000380 [Theileria orientalis strain Shintoku]PVC51109.1 hypothetical protein MACL_00001724 [Theileria orientalis]BAM40117.1 uncharacterized protein TOT_020000380 [Theileria orientalis strain Shintoku]|eukprot:XP_009690418.1 uncharacterized protein TOT_020000380 [Theileria orientalis strain Shintoku]